jgi:cytochrome b
MSVLTHFLNQFHASAGEPRRRIIDSATRMFHWLFALSFAGAYITADGERWRHVHTTLGYTMIGLLVARVVWGIFGPKRSRLSSLIQRITTIVPSLKTMRRTHSLSSLNWNQVQNALMSALILALLGLTVPLVLSGYLTDIDWAGEITADLHEWFGEAYLVTVLAHIGLILMLSLVKRRNLITPMLTGLTPGQGPDLVKHNHLIWASTLLAGTMSWWIWSIF